METKIEFAIDAIKTNKVFPKTFTTYDDTERFRLKRPNPSHWKVVKREIIYGEWT